jgi:eukaryotic-like serine/threonine-protein kinase
VGDGTLEQITDPIRVGDRYVLGEVIGRGGMARIHRAHDEVLDRYVAVKVLHPHLAEDPAFLARFRREAQAAAALSHPNVVAVHDWGETATGAYLVLQLIDGVSLRAVLDERGSLDPAEALAVIGPAAAGLGAAHDAGLVHRDVKPENILIGRDGVVRVTDFGLARAAASATSTFGADVLVGSPHYLSPEAVHGQPLDPRADVYALGIMLVECVTGAPPHEADSPFATAMQHTLHPVPAPSAVRPELGTVLDEVVAIATAMDRDRRYADATRFARALSIAVPGQAARIVTPGSDTPRDTSAHAAGDDPAAVAGPPTRQETTRMPRVDRDAPTQLVVAMPAASTPPPPPTSNRGSAGDTTSLPPPPPPSARVLDDPDPAADDREFDHGDEDEAVDERARGGRRRRGRGWLAFLLILLLLGGSAAAGYLVWDRVLAPVTDVPSVLGEPAAAAGDTLLAAGFEVRVDDDRPFDLDVPEGHVIDQDPQGVLRQGGTVTLVLSGGPRPVTLPDLTGESRDDALDVLTSEGLEVVVSDRFDEQVAQGIVLETLPGAEAVVDEGSTVEVVVSAGRTPITVPDLLGSGQGEAEDLLDGLGLELEVVDRRFDDRPAGQIIDQEPGADATRFGGDTVEVVVSEGPEPVEVPGVRGERVADAVATMEALGFSVEVERRGGFGSLLNPGRVYDQDPAPGSRRPVGDQVLLYAYND